MFDGPMVCCRSDSEFGRQYKAGCNPGVLEVPAELPAGCAISEVDVSGASIRLFSSGNAKSPLLSWSLVATLTALMTKQCCRPACRSDRGTGTFVGLTMSRDFVLPR